MHGMYVNYLPMIYPLKMIRTYFPCFMEIIKKKIICLKNTKLTYLPNL